LLIPWFKRGLSRGETSCQEVMLFISADFDLSKSFQAAAVAVNNHQFCSLILTGNAWFFDQVQSQCNKHL